MSMLRSIRLFICRLYGDDVSNLTPVDKWALMNSKICSADEIIAAAIVKSIAMNYDDWIYKNNSMNSSAIRETVTLTHSIRGVTVKVEWVENIMYDIYDNFKINGLAVTDLIGKEIRSAYVTIKTERQRIKIAAEKALAEQKRLEAAWNLAENLLGMKRNEFGALVPVVTTEE